jgi:hypothetical protein
MLTIKLRIAGKEKTLTQDFISGRMFRRTVAMQKVLTQKVDETVLDELVNYVVDLFDKQFTLDEFYDGIDSRMIMRTIIDCVNTVTNGASEAIGADASDPN